MQNAVSNQRKNNLMHVIMMIAMSEYMYTLYSISYRLPGFKPNLKQMVKAPKVVGMQDVHILAG